MIPIALEKIETDSKFEGFLTTQETEMKKELLKDGEIQEKDLYKFSPLELKELYSQVNQKKHEIFVAALEKKRKPVEPKEVDPQEICKEDLDTCDKHMKQELEQ